jgi:hypothetical protein
MTRAEMRQAKAELHCRLLEMVEIQGGTEEEIAEMYQYIIEQASRELVRFVIKKDE